MQTPIRASPHKQVVQGAVLGHAPPLARPHTEEVMAVRVDMIQRTLRKLLAVAGVGRGEKVVQGEMRPSAGWGPVGKATVATVLSIIFRLQPELPQAAVEVAAAL